MDNLINLTLPLPPDPWAIPPHPMERAKVKNRYRREAWAAVIQQEKPWIAPPAFVEVTAVFFTQNPWDEDNRTAGLKFILDALKQEQTGNMRWRQGISDRCGYFIDDDPGHMRLTGIPGDERERERPRVEIIIEWEWDPEAAA